MNKLKWMAIPCAAVLFAACSTTPPKPTGYRVYVTNEVSGDLSILDSEKMEVVATVPLGKRPRGIHASPDGKFIAYGSGTNVIVRSVEVRGRPNF